MASAASPMSPTTTAKLEELANSNKSYDYIIVGGGTAGPLLASHLSKNLPSSSSSSSSLPSILLIEAGPNPLSTTSTSKSNATDPILTPGKYLQPISAAPKKWHYSTIPQPNLNNRIINFPFEKSLGGNSNINWMGWARGLKDDWDAWAEMVGDDTWRWDEVLEIFKSLEDFDATVPAGMEKYVNNDRALHSKLHGKGGPIGVGFGKEWMPGIDTFIDSCEQVGIPLNPDGNSGEPLGASVGQVNVSSGERNTSARSFLSSPLPNLMILTETQCSRVLFSSSASSSNKSPKATAVELFSTSSSSNSASMDPMFYQINCNREIILSSGTFGTPKILLRSGIGPSTSLSPSTPHIVNLPSVGQNIADHISFSLEYQQPSSILSLHQLFSNPSLLHAAEEEYAAHRTGPLVSFGGSFGLAFFKLPRLEGSKEWAELEERDREWLGNERRPSTEVWVQSGPLYYDGKGLEKEDSVVAHEMLLQNNLSRGRLWMEETDARVPPKIDMQYLSHPYDLRLAIETVRKTLAIAKAPAYSKSIIKPLLVPKTVDGEPLTNFEDDEAIERFVRENVSSGSHAMGSCRMGKGDNWEGSVVDSAFRVHGVDGLRIADLSVCPLLTNNHTQINVYLIAKKCGRKIVEEVKRKTSSRL